MGLQELTLDHKLRTRLEDVYPHVLDFRKFGEAHPYMTKVELVKQTREFNEFFVKEKVLLFGFIPQRPSYHAKVFEVEQFRHIRYTSNVMGMLDLSINFTFSALLDQSGTLLTEKISINGNKLFSKILIGIMEESHNRLFKTIEQNYLKV
jgi:hypothetical protein